MAKPEAHRTIVKLRRKADELAKVFGEPNGATPPKKASATPTSSDTKKKAITGQLHTRFMKGRRLHWTQRPENRERLMKMVRRGARARVKNLAAQKEQTQKPQNEKPEA